MLEVGPLSYTSPAECLVPSVPLLFGSNSIMVQPIRIFIVDDHGIFRESLVAVFGMHKDLQVVGQAGTVEDAKKQLKDLSPDILLLDMRLSGGQSGLDLLREIGSLN